jgi:hypothetical protein
MKFNEEMHKAGILVASEGLAPGGRGARIETRKGRRTVVDGPFTESKELVGGFYLIDVSSLDARSNGRCAAHPGWGSTTSWRCGR